MTTHAAGLYELRLELARQRDCPNGDSGHGYDLIAPLTRDGHLDVSLWQADQAACRVRRFRRDRPDIVGHLKRSPRGQWYFDFGPEAIKEEPGFRFGEEYFASGQYISIREAEGKFHDFRIAAVRPLERDLGKTSGHQRAVRRDLKRRPPRPSCRLFQPARS